VPILVATPIVAATPAAATIGIITIIGIATIVVGIASTIIPDHHDIRLAPAEDATTRTPHQTQNSQTNDASAHNSSLQEHRYNATSVQFREAGKRPQNGQNVSPFGRLIGTF